MTDYDGSNYAASAEALISALRCMCAEADETGRPYVVSDGGSDWDLDCLEDAIHEGNRDCFERYGDLFEPEDYAVIGKTIRKWENGSWSGCEMYCLKFTD